MARRMIRARRASPYQLYLLIAFVVISVGLGVGLAWTWSLMDQHNVNTFGLERLERAKESGGDVWREVLDKYQGEGAALVDVIEAKEKLANEYRFEIQRLTERLLGDPFSTQQGQQLRQSVSDVLKATNEVLGQCSDALKKSYQVVGQQGGEVQMTSMQVAVRSAIQRIEALVIEVRQNNQSMEDLKGRIRGLQAELATAKEEHAVQVAQHQQILADERARLTAARDSAVKQSGQFSDEMKRLQDEYLARQREWKKEKADLEREILTLDNVLNDLKEKLERLGTLPTELAADGHVVKVAELGSIAYADIGKKDGVLLGMPFSVFSPVEFGKEEPTPKASARVVRIMDDASELRVTVQGNEPIVAGDVLHNPVYDRGRRLRFLLIGKIDMDGDGTDDSGSLKALIQELGGRVETELSVQTDYLISGEQPVVPAAPAQDAGPMEQQLNEEARAAFVAYTTAMDRAKDFGIPILSLNRFLGLMGLAGRD
ncbi:MAG TPA: BRCT domain-containing protein [Phycisphaerae bacterium]|nr:BRCT domain-containing protein [Phycisphaerae bacterium]